MPLEAENLVIVPVMASYDRIFETHNLTSEMVKGRGQELSFLEYMRRIYTFRQDHLGEVFVKYLEPIHIKSYSENGGFTSIQDLSFSLSSELYFR